MTAGSRIAATGLTVLLDVRHPLAYLALQPAAALTSELGVEIDWLPLVAPPLNPPSTPKSEDDRGILHRRHRAHAIAREIEIYTEVRGLLLREYYRAEDPSAVNLGWLWMRERHPEQLQCFLEEVFRAYWAVELDCADESAIASIVAASCGDAADFRSWAADAGRVACAELAEELRERGVQGVPCYLVEDEVFLGRQHLPMIRWILEGRSGPVPI